MNYIVIFVQIFVLFYMMYMFHETYQNHYYVETTCLNRYALGFLVSCFVILFVPKSCFIFIFYGILIIFPVFMYYKEVGYVTQLFSYYMILMITTIVMLCITYIISILPMFMYPFNYRIEPMFCTAFVIFSLWYLQYKLNITKTTYITLVICCLLLVFLISGYLFVHDEIDQDHMVVLLPLAFIICLIGIFRLFYSMETSKDNILELTIQRYADKENKERFDVLEKENKMIMQQMHDMKKHLRMLDNMKDTKEEFDIYKKEIEDKAEEILYMNVTENSLLNRILQTYQPRLKELRIQCNFEIDDVDYSFIDMIDISALLSNLLDNAIESCIKCEERFLLLKFKKQSNFMVIKMKNSCENIIEEDGVLKTTKENPLYHGYGMYNMRMIAKKYHGELKYHFEQEHQLFVTTITLFPNQL